MIDEVRYQGMPILCGKITGRGKNRGINGAAVDMVRYMENIGLSEGYDFAVAGVDGRDARSRFGVGMMDLSDGVILIIPRGNELWLTNGFIGGYERIHNYLNSKREVIKSHAGKK
jgi:hypothetical protein